MKKQNKLKIIVIFSALISNAHSASSSTCSTQSRVENWPSYLMRERDPTGMLHGLFHSCRRVAGDNAHHFPKPLFEAAMKIGAGLPKDYKTFTEEGNFLGCEDGWVTMCMKSDKTTFLTPTGRIIFENDNQEDDLLELKLPIECLVGLIRHNAGEVDFFSLLDLESTIIRTLIADKSKASDPEFQEMPVYEPDLKNFLPTSKRRTVLGELCATFLEQLTELRFLNSEIEPAAQIAASDQAKQWQEYCRHLGWRGEAAIPRLNEMGLTAEDVEEFNAYLIANGLDPMLTLQEMGTIEEEPVGSVLGQSVLPYADEIDPSKTEKDALKEELVQPDGIVLMEEELRESDDDRVRMDLLKNGASTVPEQVPTEEVGEAKNPEGEVQAAIEQVDEIPFRELQDPAEKAEETPFSKDEDCIKHSELGIEIKNFGTMYPRCDIMKPYILNLICALFSMAKHNTDTKKEKGMPIDEYEKNILNAYAGFIHDLESGRKDNRKITFLGQGKKFPDQSDGGYVFREDNLPIYLQAQGGMMRLYMDRNEVFNFPYIDSAGRRSFAVLVGLLFKEGEQICITHFTDIKSTMKEKLTEELKDLPKKKKEAKIGKLIQTFGFKDKISDPNQIVDEIGEALIGKALKGPLTPWITRIV